MTEITNNMLLRTDANGGLHLSVAESRQRGVALLVVLLIIMVITVLSLGFLSSSNVELVCGQNMVSVTQLDYLAESGLEHAKGLIVSPQDVNSEDWEAQGQWLSAGNDYYDVKVTRDDSDPADWCNYVIDCNAYRIVNGEQMGFRGLSGQLRLDPCIALWTGTSSRFWSGITVHAMFVVAVR
jgi:hypothetical protein